MEWGSEYPNSDDVRNYTQLMAAAISHTMRFLFLGAAIATSGSSLADDKIFEIDEISRDGRVVNARFADFDGDGRKDLMVVTLTGIPPEEQRSIRIHLQDSDGSYPSDPSRVVPIPDRSAVFDIADVKDAPGEELVLLRPDGITILSIADTEIVEWNIPVEGPSTVAAADDERGFDSFKLVYEMGSQPLILVPQIGLVSVLTVDGTLMGQVDVGRRANYFVARRPSIISVESDLQLYLDTPKLSIGDVDGDERADIVAATRHEIRVFLRRSDGRFDREPSYTHALKTDQPTRPCPWLRQCCVNRTRRRRQRPARSGHHACRGNVLGYGHDHVISIETAMVAGTWRILTISS